MDAKGLWILARVMFVTVVFLHLAAVEGRGPNVNTAP